MLQPELGEQLMELRNRHALTQEELATKSRVSSRTIQRIEAGDVVPRLSTVKLLWQAVGENYVEFRHSNEKPMQSLNYTPSRQQAVFLTAVLAGVLYIAFETVLLATDALELLNPEFLPAWYKWFYVGFSVALIVAFAFYTRGLVELAKLFENKLLEIASIGVLIGNAAGAVLGIVFLGDFTELANLVYAGYCIIMGGLSVLFGFAMLRLEDGMGGMAKVCGVLEICIGMALLSVFLFPVALLLLVPATILECLLLYQAYTYISRSR